MLSSSTGLFSFQFSSMDGLKVMLENGSWFIRNHQLILKKWNPNMNLLKEDVKIYGVPVTAFSEDGLRAIATKLDTILVAMPQIAREAFYMCTIRVDYEWKSPRCVRCKVFGHIQEERPKNRLGKLKKLIIDGKVTLVNDDGKPLKEVDYPGDHDGEDESDSYENGDYDEYPYDNDMYEGQDLLDKIQDICDNLDIRVRVV
nr:hypothetical protein [Tanacetum cinerariifolium]